MLGGMRHIAIALTLVAALSSCVGQECELCGRWQSNAELTLAEMEKSSVLSVKQRQLFRTNFYGRLIVETRETDSRAYFSGESPDSAKWESWQVVSRSGNTLVIKLPIGDELVTRSITFDGECYRVDQPNLGFGEWFCRSR
jgi:hypothetical protein